MDKFLDNKYTRWYYKIVNYRKQNLCEGYVERHHITPKCMGGNNKKDNLVDLTAREHFICHLLLTKMVEKNNSVRYKLLNALSMMLCSSSSHNNNRYIPSSRIYQYFREEWSKVFKENIPSKRPEVRKKISDKAKGRTLSQEAKKKISDANKGKIVSLETRKKMSDFQKKLSIEEKQRRAAKNSAVHKGKIVSEESRQKMSDAKKNNFTPWNKGKKGLQIPWNKGKTGIYSEEYRKKISDKAKDRIPWNKGKKGLQIPWNTGKKHSEETKRKISVAHKGKIPWNKGKRWKKSKRKTQDHSLEDFFS